MGKSSRWKYVYTEHISCSEKLMTQEMLENIKEELKQFAKAVAEQRNLEIKEIEFEVKDDEKIKGYEDIVMTAKMQNKVEKEPVEPELEGGGFYWWVCGECHTQVERGYEKCPECGRRILW